MTRPRDAETDAKENPAPRVHAPELTGAFEWFNVDTPLTIRALRGKVVLLDFWTYGCVNCMHILPDLKRLEEKYARELVVVGVHSAKFANERKADNIRHIVMRYDITHPVVNDKEFAIWKAYGARAWPTQVLIDPEGYVVATASGEGKAEAFDRAIAAVIHVFDEHGGLDRRPLKPSLERERLQISTLAFPGKVLADEASGRLFIADSNHHRILVATLDGQVTDVIGRASRGSARPRRMGRPASAGSTARSRRRDSTGRRDSPSTVTCSSSRTPGIISFARPTSARVWSPRSPAPAGRACGAKRAARRGRRPSARRGTSSLPTGCCSWRWPGCTRSG